jgi:hypothetical protein
MNIKSFPAKSNTHSKTCDRCRALRTRRGGVSATFEGVSKFVCAACVKQLQGWQALERHAMSADAGTERRAA